MNETSNMALHTHVLYGLKVWLKLVSSEVYFTHEGETVSRAFIAFHWSWMNETSKVALRTHTL
jgi:hypothetical protein